MFKSMLKGLLKKVGEEVMDSSIGDKLRQAEAEVNAQLAKEMNEKKASGSSSTYVAPNHTAFDEAPSASASQTVVGVDITEECALTVPAEDGARGDFIGLSEKTYSYLLPKDEGFVDEGTCHTAEIHQAYGFGKEINYTRDMMMYFSIAPEFDCEIKESRPKAAFSRYDGAPTRSGLTTVEHPFFTHAYLFENSKIYRISYLKQMSESEILACELALKKSGGDAAWKEKMVAEFKRFAGSCREA